MSNEAPCGQHQEPADRWPTSTASSTGLFAQADCMLAHLQRIILTASKTLFGARLVCEGAPELLDQLTHTPFVIEEAKFLRTFAEFTHKITEKMSSFFLLLM